MGGLLLLLGLLLPSTVLGFTYERLDKTQAMLMIVDQQEGLYQIARDHDPVHFRNDILAHAALAQVFSLPTVITSSTDTGTFTPSSSSTRVPDA